MSRASCLPSGKFLFGVNEPIPAGTYQFGIHIAPGWYSLADPSGIVVSPAYFPAGAIIQSKGSFVLFAASIQTHAPVTEVPHG